MSRSRSKNPFDDDYEDLGEADSNGNNNNNTPSSSNYKNSFVLGDEHPHKYIKQQQQQSQQQQRSMPLAFSSNPFQDDPEPFATPKHPNSTNPSEWLPKNSPAGDPISPWGSTHSSAYAYSPQQNHYQLTTTTTTTPGDPNWTTNNSTSSEVSPLLPDDLSRSYNSAGSSQGMPVLNRRKLAVPKRIFTGSPSHSNSQSQSQSRRKRSGTRPRPPNSFLQKADDNPSLLQELAVGGGDGDNSIHMEYKYILLEDLGTASSWTILVLPYATFGFSVVLLYLGAAPVASMGWTVTALRLVCCFVMLCFIGYWIRKMEMIRLCCGSCTNLGRGVWRGLVNCLVNRDKDDDDDEDLQVFSDEMDWWKNPWVLFPERYYILPLLLSSLLVLEPIPVAIYFFPSIGTPELYAIAQACSGVGIQACSLIYLCLVQGFRFHTAVRSKRRAELQRKALQLRKAARTLSEDDHQEFVSSPRIVQNYYDEVGDMDGNTIAGRLPSDPCASGWADFLLPKLFLLVVGALSTTLVAVSEPSNPLWFPNNSKLHNTLYVVGSIVYAVTLCSWTYLTLVALYVTGERLKKEPFLGTRPAQLAYRILAAHSGLAIMGLGIASMEYFDQLQGSIQLGLGSIDVDAIVPAHPGTLSFPGMFGKLVCLTVQVAITAFIFLPPHTMDYEEYGDDDQQDLTDLQILSKKRRDKRLVVHLAKDSRTWRIFPCPIQNKGDDGNLFSAHQLQETMFQIYKDFHTDTNTHHRGLVSIGPYTPIFCAELACWLNEASWQAYNSPVGSPETEHYDPNDHPEEKTANHNQNTEGDFGFCGWMRLDFIGLQLEGYVYDERTNTQAYIATNSATQVDGEEDSVIVVAFRGTSDATNVKTDFRVRQVPLYDQITGIGESAFRVFPDRFEVSDADGWIWDTNAGKGSEEGKEYVKCVGCWSDNAPPCTPTRTPAKPPQEGRQRLYSVGGMEGVVSKETADILKGAPLARNSFPMVHEGFQDAYNEIRKQLFDLLLPVLQRQLAKSIRSSQGKASKADLASEPLALPKIYCTGHSLGGSLAQLFALDLASNCELVLPVQQPPPRTSPKSPFGIPSVEPHARFFPLSPPLAKPKQEVQTEMHLVPPIGVYTYGQPRVGNKAFSRLYKQKVPHSFRVVNEGDAFTTIPNYFWCGGQYKHAGLEVILDGGKTGNVLVGPTVVETLFRFHKVRTNVMAHQMQRYRECLECIFDHSQLMEYYKDHNIAYEELAADLKIDARGADEEDQRNPDATISNPNHHWMDGEITEKDGLEWYH